MLSRNVGLHTLAVAAFALMAPSLSMAGSPSAGTVTLGPASMAAAATAVPALTPGMLVGLGILLAVIAVRVLRQSGAAQRIVSVVLLGGGVLLAGLGVEKTVATNTLETGTADCESAAIEVEYFEPDRTDSQVTNECSIDLEVVAYNLNCIAPSEFTDNGSPVGTLVPAGETTPLGYCAFPEPT